MSPRIASRRETKACTAGTDSRVVALWMPRDRGRLRGQLVEMPKIEQRTLEQLQVVDVLAVGEVKLIPQERVRQRVDCMEVVQCEEEQERISECIVEQTEVFFVAGSGMSTSVACRCGAGNRLSSSVACPRGAGRRLRRRITCRRGAGRRRVRGLQVGGVRRPARPALTRALLRYGCHVIVAGYEVSWSKCRRSSSGPDAM